jgi:hypothetical protein
VAAAVTGLTSVMRGYRKPADRAVRTAESSRAIRGV